MSQHMMNDPHLIVDTTTRVPYGLEPDTETPDLNREWTRS
jgi:hypothetical protein